MSIGRNTARPATPESVTLQWANGKTVYRPQPGVGRFVPLVGFHIEVGKDEDLDHAAHKAGLPVIEIKHQRQGGAELVKHWLVAGEADTLRFFTVTSGPVGLTMAGCLGRNAPATAEAGLGARWAEGERSKLAVRGYVEALAKAGYLRLVQLSTRSRMTDVLLACLLDHGRVCEAADGLVDRNRHPEVVTFHEIALPLGAGEPQDWGKGDTTEVTPFTCLHPEQVTADYLRTVWRPDSVHATALRDWEGIQAWAQSYAQEGEEQPAGRPAPAYADDAL
jgi:hypothetical protein